MQHFIYLFKPNIFFPTITTLIGVQKKIEKDINTKIRDSSSISRMTVGTTFHFY